MNPPPPQEKGKLPASLRDPSTLFYQYASVRGLIIAVYWVVILLAVPIWWQTTSIERLPLPISQASQEVGKSLQLPVNICVQETQPRIAPLLRNALDRLSESRELESLQLHVVDCGNDLNQDVYVVKPGRTKTLSQRVIEYPLGDTKSVDELARTLVSLISPHLNDNRAVQFASRYRLAFSLLNEDAAKGSFVAGWDIEGMLQRYINPILNRMSHLHNFTIESQVQFHAPLAFDVRKLDNNEHGLSYEDLTIFVNSAEWTLSSSFSNDPVIHLVLFVPSADHSPLRILETDGTISASNSFVLPQWGSIVLCNPSEGELDVAFSSFSNQLLSLLGVPQLPPGIKHDDDLISDWQFDALLRRRTLETLAGTKETLESFIKLVNRIENMPIGQSVSDDVHNALNSLNKAYDLASTSLAQTFTYSAGAFNFASRAFFNPGMLALLYFPAEHKYAVYTPLFASAMVPLFITGLRELKAWNQRRKAQSRNGSSATLS